MSPDEERPTTPRGGSAVPRSANRSDAQTQGEHPFQPVTPPATQKRTRSTAPAMHAELDGASSVLAGSVLAQSFFARDATVVARDLIGKILVRPGDALAARIVETEAYRNDDRACHAYGGRTVTNGPLWGPPGHAYVYRSYGIHWCFNVATGADGEAQGVLIRAAVPLQGLCRMHERRGLKRLTATAGPPSPAQAHAVHGSASEHRELLRGPGKLCKAFAISDEHRTQSLCDAAGTLHFREDGENGVAAPEVRAGPRVGVARAADVPWRFVAVADVYWASPYVRSPRAPKAAKVGRRSGGVETASAEEKTPLIGVAAVSGDAAGGEVGGAKQRTTRASRAAKRAKPGASG